MHGTHARAIAECSSHVDRPHTARTTPPRGACCERNWARECRSMPWLRMPATAENNPLLSTQPASPNDGAGARVCPNKASPTWALHGADAGEAWKAVVRTLHRTAVRRRGGRGRRTARASQRRCSTESPSSQPLRRMSVMPELRPRAVASAPAPRAPI